MLSYDLLLSGKPPADSLLCDKVYMTAHAILSHDGCYRFLIDKKRTPVVRFDTSIPIEAPTRDDMKLDATHSMFASNVIIKINGLGYPVTIRGGDAYLFPNHYTCPAGRCDMLPRDTAIAEFNEEMLIVVKNRVSGELRMLGVGDKRLAEEGKVHKEKELVRSLPPLLMLHTEWLCGKHKYSVEMGNYSDFWAPTSDASVLESGSCTVVKDESLNTYELCFTVSADLPDDWMLEAISDGERYNNEVVLVKDLLCLPIDKCVPALRGYILNM